MIDFKTVPPNFLEQSKPELKDFNLLREELSKYLDRDVLQKASILTFPIEKNSDIIDIIFTLLNEFYFDKLSVSSEFLKQLDELKVSCKNIFYNEEKTNIEYFLTALIISSIKILQQFYEKHNSTSQR